MQDEPNGRDRARDSGGDATTNLTNQEIFDFVARALLKQGEPSIWDGEDGSNCRYRGPDGLKCAAGHLIADEHYSPSLEGQQCGCTEVRAALLASGVHPDSLVLVAELQQAHDNPAHDKDWRWWWPIEMHRVAKTFGLDASVLAAPQWGSP